MTERGGGDPASQARVPLHQGSRASARSACRGTEGGLGLAGARVSLLPMSSPGSIARRVVLVSAAALCLHGLRAKAGWGGHAHGGLDTAHAYLAGATWVVVVVGAAVAAHFLFRLAAPPRSVSGGCGPRRGVWWSWGWTSVALVCVCFGQELLEHLWVTGHLPALGVVWSAGGWSAVLLAGLLGAGVTAAARGSDAVLALPFGGDEWSFGGSLCRRAAVDLRVLILGVMSRWPGWRRAGRLRWTRSSSSGRRAPSGAR